MARHAIKPAGETASSGPAIDRAHLARMTFGEAALERELLALFETQAELLIARMREDDGNAVPALAHTLKGSASGIGALPVARAAEALERASEEGGRARALARLAAEVAAARAAIAQIRRG